MSSSCRASERDPVARVESCQRSLLWLLQSHRREPLRRCWNDHPYGEEEITWLEDELLLAMESFLARIDAIDQQLREPRRSRRPSSSWSGRPERLRGLSPRRCWCLFEAPPGGCHCGAHRVIRWS
jgi:hypothetical protein